ncbi:hypothetical protein ACOMHN_024567 [Nucella lapillus]
MDQTRNHRLPHPDDHTGPQKDNEALQCLETDVWQLVGSCSKGQKCLCGLWIGLEKQGSLFLWIGSLTGFERVTILSSTKLSYCSCPMIPCHKKRAARHRSPSTIIHSSVGRALHVVLESLQPCRSPHPLRFASPAVPLILCDSPALPFPSSSAIRQPCRSPHPLRFASPAVPLILCDSPALPFPSSSAIRQPCRSPHPLRFASPAVPLILCDSPALPFPSSSAIRQPCRSPHPLQFARPAVPLILCDSPALPFPSSSAIRQPCRSHAAHLDSIITATHRPIVPQPQSRKSTGSY